MANCRSCWCLSNFPQNCVCTVTELLVFDNNHMLLHIVCLVQCIHKLQTFPYPVVSPFNFPTCDSTLAHTSNCCVFFLSVLYNNLCGVHMRVYPKASGLAAWSKNCKWYSSLPAIRCSCITILWVSLMSFAAITLCVASQQVFVVVYFVIDSVQELLDIPLYGAVFLIHPLNWLSLVALATQCFNMLSTADYI
jgi:hypothetical protein